MRLSLLGLEINTGRYSSFVENICSLAQYKASSYVCVANVHMLVEAHYDKSFARVVNGADLVTPDGKPLAWGIRLLYAKRQDRVAGMDLLPDLLQKAGEAGIPVYFCGGAPATIENTVRFVKETFPGLVLAGAYSPPFRQLTEAEEEMIINNINTSGAKMVFVALGCPKQEKWMASMKNRINACMIGIGGALPVMIGAQKRAPKWMQKSSLEWLYRLVQEPRRLFKRYAVTNSIFIFLLLKQWGRQLFLPRKVIELTPPPSSGHIRIHTKQTQETTKSNETQAH